MSARQGPRVLTVGSTAEGVRSGDALLLGFGEGAFSDGVVEVEVTAPGYRPWKGRVRKLGSVPCVTEPAVELAAWLLPEK